MQMPSKFAMQCLASACRWARGLRCVSSLTVVRRRYEQVNTSEYASMFQWYAAFEAQTFRQPPGLRDAMRRWTLNLYPGVIKAAMAVFDVVESIAVSRTRICKAGGLHALTRVQARSLPY